MFQGIGKWTVSLFEFSDPFEVETDDDDDNIQIKQQGFGDSDLEDDITSADKTISRDLRQNFDTTSNMSTTATKTATTAQKAEPKPPPPQTAPAKKTTLTTPGTGAAATMPGHTPTTVGDVDAAGKVYGGVKGAWAWTKGVIVFKPFLGLAEGVAGKVVSLATNGGASLKDVDGAVQDQLHGLDAKILNPAIGAVLHIVFGAASKTKGFVQPIIWTLLTPLHFMMKDHAETANQTPEVTTPPMTSTATTK